MPIYEYRCKKGHTFDIMQRFSDEPLTMCEVCGASAQRVMHAPSIHFKGSGFYNTDYGTKKRAREMKEHKDSKERKEGAKSESSSNGSDAKTSSSSDSGSKSSNGSGDSGSAKKPESSSSSSKAKAAE